MSQIETAVAGAAAGIPAAAWQALTPPGHPFLDRDFLAIVERTGVAGPAAGWQAAHLVARRNGAVVGILPLYLKSHCFGDFVPDWNWATLWQQFGRDYFPRLVTLLPHTPAGGPRLLVAPRDPEPAAVRAALIAAARRLAADNGLSSWHVGLASDADIAALEDEGLSVSHDVQFHWHDAGFGDFAGFLASLAAEKRRKLRAERRRVAESGLTIAVRHGDEIDPAEWPALHAIYRSTFDRYGNHAAFSAAAFAELAAALGPRMVAFTASEGGRPVALSLCFRSADTLYGRYWGALHHYDSLHFELCLYRGIDYCLQHGLARFEPGAGGEHKLARGFTPRIVRSAHWIVDPALRTTIARHLERQRAAVGAYRDEAAAHLPYRRNS
jgi:predicted N-acyltransferase